jgi:2'-5' RNA ligase
MQIYEKLWREAMTAFERGRLQIDPNLSDKKNDLRRGVTIILRPSLPVRAKIKRFLDQLFAVCPAQYFYRPEEFHVTVLSIISGTEFWEKEIRHLDSYRAVISSVLRNQRSFKIGFRGVTASRGAVMIQGFPDRGLSKIRDELRAAFARNGFGGILDRRYKINTAHVTVMRFSEPVPDWKRLASLLEENRKTNFGEMEVTCLQLIWSDWYASADVVQKIQEYHLAD